MNAKYKTTKRISKKVIQEILKIKEEKGLTAENVVDKAKDKSNILHDFFVWNDSEAGRLYRKQQARALINEIKIIVEDKELYAFESVNISLNESMSKKEYKTLVEVLDNDGYKEQIINRAIRELKYWKNKYDKLLEFRDLVKKIEKTLEKWQ